MLLGLRFPPLLCLEVLKSVPLAGGFSFDALGGFYPSSRAKSETHTDAFANPAEHSQDYVSVILQTLLFASLDRRWLAVNGK